MEYQRCGRQMQRSHESDNPCVECSTFLLRHGTGPFFGKNVDIPCERPCKSLLVVNKRGDHKLPLRLPEVRSEGWISKYGSVTFAAFGKELPVGGMNETGMVIEPMSLMETQYPPVGGTARLEKFQWVQYVLDCCSTVREVVKATDIVQPIETRSHFLVADSTGECAAIEFLHGRAVFHSGESLPVTAMTNSTYKESLQFLSQHLGFGGEQPSPSEYQSLPNFVRIAHGLHTASGNREAPPEDLCFSILHSVSDDVFTKRTTVYDINRRRAIFHTPVCRKIRYVDLERIDFSVDGSVMMLDIDADAEGDVSGEFVPLTAEANEAVTTDLSQMLLDFFPADHEVALLSTFGDLMGEIQRYSSQVAV